MKDTKQRIEMIKDGTVIDHIPSENTLKVIEILKLDSFLDTVSIAFNLESHHHGLKMLKGLIKIENKFLTPNEINTVALLAPNGTMNIIKDYKIMEKKNIALPNEFKGIIKGCPHHKCITNVEKNMKSYFKVLDIHNHTDVRMKCYYCEREFGKEDILNYL